MDEPNLFKDKEIKSLDSIEDWKEEIRNVLNGEREGFLIKYGSVGKYIDMITHAYSKNKSLDYFDDALIQIISSWQPYIEKEKEYFSVMLELIRTYTPIHGSGKVFDFIKFWKDSIEKIDNKFGYDSNINLIKSAIATLNTYPYFRFPLETTSSEVVKLTYKLYKELLEELMLKPELSGFIINMCLKSSIFEIDDKKIKDLISVTPEILSNMVSYVYSFNEEKQVDLLPSLAKMVFEVGEKAIVLFEKRLNLYETIIDYKQPNLVIKQSNKIETKIELTGTSYKNFMKVKQNIHLLPEYLTSILNKRDINENKSKIQKILDECHKAGAEVVLQFRKQLHAFEDLRLGSPKTYNSTALRIEITFGNIEFYIISKFEFYDAWTNFDEDEFEELIKEDVYQTKDSSI